MTIVKCNQVYHSRDPQFFNFFMGQMPFLATYCNEDGITIIAMPSTLTLFRVFRQYAISVQFRAKPMAALTWEIMVENTNSMVKISARLLTLKRTQTRNH